MQKSLGHFPTIYPNELVYSAVARYFERSRIRNTAVALRTIFGKSSYIKVELPSRLESLLNALPEGHTYTVDSLIERHTTFPFYGFFAGKERQSMARSYMRGTGDLPATQILGTAAQRTKTSRFLRHCALCDSDNRRQFGETYWHRLHQLSGIEVCPRHNVFLAPTSARANDGKEIKFITAESVCLPTPTIQVEPSDPVHNVLLKLGADADWMLMNIEKSPNPEVRRQLYYSRLSRMHLITDMGMVKFSQIIREMEDIYSSDLLLRLNCDIASTKTKNFSWIKAVLQRNKAIQSPIQHLLLINFIGMSVSTFVEPPLANIANPSEHFIKGPRNCPR